MVTRSRFFFIRNGSASHAPYFVVANHRIGFFLRRLTQVLLNGISWLRYQTKGYILAQLLKVESFFPLPPLSFYPSPCEIMSVYVC